MQSCAVKTMQEADRRAIHELGIPGSVLMYNAGKTVADFIFQKYPTIKNVGILAGKGNNAGDGFVIAHILSLKGINVRIIALAQPDVYVGDALIYLNLCLKEKIDIRFPKETDEMVLLTQNLTDCELLIDSLLGTGTRGQVREPFASVIKAIPTSIPMIAVDLPSGMNGDTGEICGVCVHATHTITFAAAKKGLIGKEELTGELIVTDIGMPPICLDDEKWNKFIKGQ
ncbi:NAD(P)H-hydrate epimerase [Histomonas meleagridis]|uniref:NAD(P)H-hydrate epimerase n=1 Tax=Histomonas meleagridis TaxID=135588 RepID=UPI00355AC3DA|nr:NAD(P)H-hydrate epimerase [Histomonas meleagridis]KAH0799216.1 NAD(P)H-hydrate epimerase [Histomonas meleagridis]